MAVGAPIDPRLSVPEFEALLRNLQPKALIVPVGFGGPLAEVVDRQRIFRIELMCESAAGAGTFRLGVHANKSAPLAARARPDDVALILQTSGTTSRCKLVELTHSNVFEAANNSQIAFALEPSDRCLDVMPLFHAHGLVAGALSSLVAGASVVCTPPFDADRFFEWMEETRPTWYTAVPTMHHAIVEAAPRYAETVERSSLRFIRSASALLPMSLMEKLEQLFGVLVTESYGLSEAMQITNTPLDSLKRRPGSLGIAGSSEVAIMDENGERLGAHCVGEIVGRGPIVMTGYLNDPAATAASFSGPWFRTGDLGYLDTEGHLYLVGRLKDVINRGGEKILPQEVDQVLLGHPAISQAVTFGFPEPSLGEEVVAVLKLRPGWSATTGEIREYAASRLSEYKVPRRLLVVPEIPVGPTGKIVRRLVAEQFGPQLAVPATEGRPTIAPRDPLEAAVLRIWEETLEVRPIGVTDDFFDCGGNSLTAVRLIEKVSLLSGKELHPSVLFSASTVEHLTELVRRQTDEDPSDQPLIELKRGSGQPPFILLNGVYYGGGFYCRDLAQEMDPRQPFYTLSPLGIEPDGRLRSIEASAQAYLRTIRSRWPSGPYLLGGYSHAGLIAYEMARRLEADGERVALLVVIDQPAPDPRLRHVRWVIETLGARLGMKAEERDLAFVTWRWRLEQLWRYGQEGPRELLKFAVRTVLGRRATPPADTLASDLANPSEQRLQRLVDAYHDVVQSYSPSMTGGKVTLITAMDGRTRRTSDPTLGWNKLASQVQVVGVPGDHHSCITTHARTLGEELRVCLDEALR